MRVREAMELWQVVRHLVSDNYEKKEALIFLLLFVADFSSTLWFACSLQEIRTPKVLLQIN